MEGVDYQIEVQFNSPIHVEAQAAVDIARALEALTGNDRLSATALKNLYAQYVMITSGTYNNMSVIAALEALHNEINNLTFDSVADFVAFNGDVEYVDSITANLGSVINFEDRSLIFEPYKTFEWGFIKDGGIIATSRKRNPSIQFGVQGSYDVFLQILNDNNQIITSILKEDFLLIGYPSNLFNATFIITGVSGSAINAASIAISLPGTDSTWNGQTSSQGTKIFQLEPGEYEYTISKTGYDTITDTFTITDQNVTIEETMELSTYNITFHVTDGASIPIDSATVVFNGNTVLTYVNGDALFEDVEYGTKTYTISKTGYSVVTGSVNVNSSKTVTVSLGVGVAYWGLSDAVPVTVSTTNSSPVYNVSTYQAVEVPFNNTTTNRYLWIASPIQLTRSSTLGYYETITDSFTESTTTISGVTFYLYVSSWKTKVNTMIFDNYTA